MFKGYGDVYSTRGPEVFCNQVYRSLAAKGIISKARCSLGDMISRLVPETSRLVVVAVLEEPPAERNALKSA